MLKYSQPFLLPFLVEYSAPLSEISVPELKPFGAKWPVMFGPCPNMFGQFRDLHSGERVEATGVFKYLNYGKTGTFAGSDNNYGDFDFDSSRSSSIYSGTQLQPKALQTLACIRC